VEKTIDENIQPDPTSATFDIADAKVEDVAEATEEKEDDTTILFEQNRLHYS